MIKLIVGLGNPGDQYLKTRHNAGFWLLDEITTQFLLNKRFQGEVSEHLFLHDKVYLLKPMTFMNLSGDSVVKLSHFYKILPEEILVVHDELDFPAGVIRFKKGGGHGGHNGLRDIIAKLGSKDFLRLRVGIDHPNHKDVANYVLKSPAKQEKIAIDNALSDGVKAIEMIFKNNLDDATQWLHSRS